MEVFGPSHIQKFYHSSSNMHVELGFLQTHCVQMANMVRDIMERSSVGRQHLSLMNNSPIMNSCFLQYKTLLEELANVTHSF